VLRFLKRLFTTVVFICAVIANCQNGGLSPELQKRIEHQVRAYAEAPPEATITLLARRSSEFPGYDVQPVAIKVGETTKNFDFLLAKDGSRLLYITSMDLNSDPYRRVMDRIDARNRPFRGAADAPVTVVMYDDFQCPFCAKLYEQLIPVVISEYRTQVRLVLKDLPISDAHLWARRAARDSSCLANESPEAYWAFADYVHTHQVEFNQKFKEDLGQGLDELAISQAQHYVGSKESVTNCIGRQDMTEIDASIAEAKSLNVTATPTIFVNGQEYEGVLATTQIRAALDRALAESQEKRAAK
jgi:protein-disulfide isomerase